MTNFERIKQTDKENLNWILCEIDISQEQLETMDAEEFFGLLNKKCCCIFRNEDGICNAATHIPCSYGIKRWLQIILDKRGVNWLNSEVEDEQL